MVAVSVSRSNSSFCHFGNCYRCRRHQTPSRPSMLAHSELSHPTGGSTNIRSGRNASFSTLSAIWLQTSEDPSPITLTRATSPMSFWNCWEMWSKVRRAPTLTTRWKNLGTIGHGYTGRRTTIYQEKRGGLSREHEHRCRLHSFVRDNTSDIIQRHPVRAVTTDRSPDDKCLFGVIRKNPTPYHSQNANGMLRTVVSHGCVL